MQPVVTGTLRTIRPRTSVAVTEDAPHVQESARLVGAAPTVRVRTAARVTTSRRRLTGSRAARVADDLSPLLVQVCDSRARPNVPRRGTTLTADSATADAVTDVAACVVEDGRTGWIVHLHEPKQHEHKHDDHQREYDRLKVDHLAHDL
jgi:hypothetical protein